MGVLIKFVLIKKKACTGYSTYVGFCQNRSRVRVNLPHSIDSTLRNSRLDVNAIIYSVNFYF